MLNRLAAKMLVASLLLLFVLTWRGQNVLTLLHCAPAISIFLTAFLEMDEFSGFSSPNIGTRCKLINNYFIILLVYTLMKSVFNFQFSSYIRGRMEN